LGENTTEIKHRTGQTRKAINALNYIWWHKNSTKNRKLYIYQTIFHSILMYGAEVWQIPTREILQSYGHVKKMPQERIPKLIMKWIPQGRRQIGRPGKTWMKGVQAAMTTRNLEPDQWRNREEWRLVSGRRLQLL
jgi:hypothetical protein